MASFVRMGKKRLKRSKDLGNFKGQRPDYERRGVVFESRGFKESASILEQDKEGTIIKRPWQIQRAEPWLW